MKENNLYQVGGSLAILVALGFMLVGITFLLTPGPQQPGGDFEQFMLSIAEDPTIFRLSLWARILVALAGLGALPTITGLVNEQGEGWALWARNLGYLALAVMAVENLRRSFFVPIEAQVYAGANDTLRQMIGGDNLHVTLDPNGWMQFGVLGLSLLLISLLALRTESLPRGWAIAGIVDSLLLWLVVVGNVLGAPLLITVAAILGGVVLGPIWFIWAGVLVRRQETAVTHVVQEHSLSY